MHIAQFQNTTRSVNTKFDPFEAAHDSIVSASGMDTFSTLSYKCYKTSCAPLQSFAQFMWPQNKA